MKRIGSGLMALFLVGSWSGLLAPAARADMVLQQYEFQGQPGTETSLAATNVATGLTGTAFGESAGLTPAAASNSISSTGWNTAGVFYSFGFTINSGLVATVNQLILTSRSSGTGPGFLNVQESVDGGAFATVASFAQGNATYNDQMLTLTPLAARRSVVFHIVAANTTSAAGGTTAATGTFRMGDYNPSGTPTPFTLNGTLAPAAPVAVPEPSALALTLLGLGSAGLLARGRRRAA